MLCLSFYGWRGIYPGEQMILAPFLEKNSFDRAAGRFADYLFASKHAKVDVLLTTVLGPLRSPSDLGYLLNQQAASTKWPVLQPFGRLWRSCNSLQLGLCNTPLFEGRAVVTR